MASSVMISFLYRL